MTGTSHGIDVSDNQSAQDWAKHKATGVAFAFIKASEGEHTRDQRFSEHVAGARKAGIGVLGGYHFAWPNESVTANAVNYIKAVRPHATGRFVHWLDLEAYGDDRNTKGKTAAEIRSWVINWCTMVQAAFPGHRVGIYAGNRALDAGWVPIGLPLWYPDYPLPRMTVAQAGERDRPKHDGRPVAFWQFTSNPLDTSLAYVSAAELEAWAGGSTAGPSPSLPKPAPARKPPRVWTVKRGQTLSAIALAFGVSVAAVAGFNHISNPDRIYPGERITAPPTPAAKKPAPKGETTCPR